MKTIDHVVDGDRLATEVMVDGLRIYTSSERSLW